MVLYVWPTLSLHGGALHALHEAVRLRQHGTYKQTKPSASSVFGQAQFLTAFDVSLGSMPVSHAGASNTA